MADQRNPASILQDWGGDQLLLWKRYKALLLPFSKKKKTKGLHLFVPVDRQKPIVVGEKENKVLCNYEGIRGEPSGIQTIKSLLNDIFNIKSYEIYKKARGEKESPLSRDKAINRTRLRNDLDVLIIIQGI